MNRGSIGLIFAASLVLGCAGDDGQDDDGAGTGTAASTAGDTGDDATSVDQNMSDTVIVDTTSDGDTAAPMGSSDDDAGTLDGGSTAGSEDGSSGTTSSVQACEGMTFFATSEGSGKNGGNLGGLEGADATCQSLAEAAGQGDCTWRAYLSTSAENARDRIGNGPWQNFDGDVVATDIDALHDDGLPNGMPQLVLDEYGATVPGNEHDILTGSMENGMLLANATCSDWTDGTDQSEAGVGHSDIPNNPNFSPSWVQAHVVGGCAPNNLNSTGGAGRIYCFAL